MNSHSRKPAVIFIFVTVVLDVLSLGVIIPIAPRLIEEEFLNGNTATASMWVGLFGTVWAAMQFIFSPVMGALSDMFGRRRILLLSALGLGLDYIMMAVAPNLWWMLVGRILSGIFAASFATAAAYIADVTPPEKRAASYGLFGAAWGIGFVLGPALGGTLGDETTWQSSLAIGIFGSAFAGYLEEISLRLPFWISAALTLLNACYGYFILPESLPAENRRSFSWKRANPVGSFRLLRSHPDLLGLAGILFLYQLAHQVLSNVFVLYAGYRYQWQESTIGYTLGAVGIAGVIVQGFLVRRAAGRLSERTMLFIGLAFGAAGYFIYGLAPTGGWFWTAIPVFALVGFFSPAIQGLMTRRVQVNEQGQLQGSNSSMMGITGMVGPVLFAWVFSSSIAAGAGSTFPGAPFIVAGCLHLLAMVLACFVLKS